MSGLHDKLYNYEQTPPTGVWDKIAAALDESHLTDEFPSRLYNTEAAPPGAAWEKIASSLEEEHAPLIPTQRRSFPLFRYAAAAVIVAALAVGVIKWTGNNKNSGKSDIALSHDTDTSGKKERVTSGQETTHENESGQGPNVEPDETSVSNPVARTTPEKKTRKKYSSSVDDSRPIYAYNEHAPAILADRYVMLMTPNGIVRMSKKLGDLVCCVSGQEQDPDCKYQLKKWQEKMAASPVAPSPGNFLDILGLVNSLNSDGNEL